MLPAIVVVQAQVDLDKRPPLGPLGFADQPHARFKRRSVRLLSVTPNTGTDNILPSGRAATVARDDVIQIEIFAIELPAAVLTGVLVSLEDIVTCEFDFLFRHSVEHHQQDHARDANAEGDSANAFCMGLRFRKVLPFAEIISLERTVAHTEDRLGMTLE